MKTITTRICILFLLLTVSILSAAEPHRQVLNLDGIWQVAEGQPAAPPAVFDHTMPVPGLVAHAVPLFDQDKTSSRLQTTFWARRSFTLPESLSEVAELRIGQVLYGFKVWMNGKFVAENPNGQAPSSFDVRKFIQPGTNEICIAMNTMPGFSPEGKRDWDKGHGNIVKPPKVPVGWDFEKDNYIPGITDSIELVTAKTPFVRLTQVVPNIQKPSATVHVWLQGVPAGKSPVAVAVREWKSGRQVGETVVPAEGDAEGNAHVVATVEIPDGRLWSPETPFLYVARIATVTDAYETRFGLRSFTFDPKSRRAILNGKPYFMRGTSYCLQRFMDDPKICKRLPWDRNWVRGFQQKGKLLHWNSVRYCIGLMPQFWYDIADEEGFLIENQYPVWTCGAPFDNSGNGTVAALAKEYRAMMEWQWNHPSVVLWDACNETATPETGLAVKQVRHLDLSDRPWSNGWSAPERPTDPVESHPYYFSGAKGYAWLAGLENTNRTRLADGKAAAHCAVVNEYGWLWINRDGSPATLTHPIYKQILGKAISPAKCRHIYALFEAAETESWRHARTAAAVMEFCALAYCHLGVGMTSDHFLENSGVEKLELEPEFVKYVGEAFAPVGVMIRFWKSEVPAGKAQPLSVSLINDLDRPWHGPVILRVKSGARVLVETKQDASIAALGATDIVFDMKWPSESGPCVLEAELLGADGEAVHSVREIEISNKVADK
ncbi:MAG: hypothetical protein NTZ16_13630 [Verrucomicrobia bacterium]|nr:hypothetical protein [Verrucomicrobiota bacterium]